MFRKSLIRGEAVIFDRKRPSEPPAAGKLPWVFLDNAHFFDSGGRKPFSLSFTFRIFSIFYDIFGVLLFACVTAPFKQRSREGKSMSMAISRLDMFPSVRCKGLAQNLKSRPLGCAGPGRARPPAPRRLHPPAEVRGLVLGRRGALREDAGGGGERAYVP